MTKPWVETMMRYTMWTIGALSVASPAPSLRADASRVLPRREYAMKLPCAGECPTPNDLGDALTQLVPGILASSVSTAQLVTGT